MKKTYLLNRLMIVNLLMAIVLVTFSCQKEQINVKPDNSSQISTFKASSPLSENYENASKGSYAAADVSLSSGIWNLNDALLGTTTSDRKSGLKSARLRNTGKLTMKFDKLNGAGAISIYHAKYGTDGSSTWDLYSSVNGGSTWTKVGSTITTSSTSLTKASFTVNQSGNIRFEIRKISGGTNRINIDDFSAADYGSSSTTATRDNNMALGNPSGAITSTSYPNNYLMTKTQYTLSYNDSKKTSNWVSWHLSTAWFGTAARQDDFRTDTSLPTSWVKVTGTSYTGSGFDRGHMCPSADRNGSVADNSATFLMTNMVPQSPILNQQTWASLENYCRVLANSGNELYIISGTYGQGGTGSNGYATSISTINIVVPSYTWKVVVVLPNGSNDVSRITTSTRVIAVLMNNNQTVNSQTWGYYRTSVDHLESLTGYNFLSNVSTSIQSTIESKIDNGPTQ